MPVKSRNISSIEYCSTFGVISSSAIMTLFDNEWFMWNTNLNPQPQVPEGMVEISGFPDSSAYFRTLLLHVQNEGGAL